MKHVARKRFGQNFLHDRFVLDDITAAIAPQPDDAMVEIGPGLGAMTEQLLRHLKQMHVVELDRDLIVRLEKTFNPAKLTIHSGDALKFDFAQIPVPAGQKLRIVGNLPYTSPAPCCSTWPISRRWCRTSISCCKRKSSSAWWPNRAARRMAACP